MPDDVFGTTDNISSTFAIELPDGKWGIRTGSRSYVEGHLHKISVGGIEVRSAGPSVGITATFHTHSGLDPKPPLRGDIRREEYVEGRLAKSDIIFTGVELMFWERPDLMEAMAKLKQ